MTNRQMEYLVTIYHEGSIRKAANKLYISQPALSQQLQRLESEIGITLFERNTVFLKPTYQGKHYLDMLEQTLLRFNQEQIWQNEAMHLMHGKLSIGISPSRSSQFLPQILNKYHKLFPAIQIELHEEYMLFLPELLQRNQIDLALMILDSFAENFVFLPLLHEKLMLVTPKGSSADKICQQSCSLTGHIDITALTQEPFVAIKSGGRIRKHTDEIFKKYCIQPNIILETKNTDLALDLCASGYGISIIAELIAKNHTKADSLNFYSLSHEIDPWTLGIAYHPNHYISKAMDAFLNLVAETAHNEFL